MDNRCVCCGEIIPEGVQVCPNCLVASKKKIELKHCPFCGGKPYLESRHRAFINAQSTRVAFVRCLSCEARSPRFELRDFGRTSYSREANKKAIEAWNRRAEDG